MSESPFKAEPLDSPQSCVRELAAINTEVAIIGHEWSVEAGLLKEALEKRDRLKRTALLGIKEKLTVPEKEATAYAAIEQIEPGLLEQVEALEGKVEQHKTLFKTLERRASNAQSILSSYRDERKFGEYAAQEPAWSGRG